MKVQCTAVDLLDQAAAMMEFMVEVAPLLAVDSEIRGISDQSAFGMSLIFRHIQDTIDQARELI